MEEKCKIISEGETLSLVTSGSGGDKDTIIYVIPFEGNETLFQSDRTLNQVRCGFFFSQKVHFNDAFYRQILIT